MSKKGRRGLAVFLASFLVFVGLFWFLIPSSNAKLKKSDFLQEKHRKYHLLAIGDSLTQGVGDTTNQGGFVPLLARRLSEAYGYEVVPSNYGISGNTSHQILQRMTKQKAIQRNLKTANLMTLTVGGNDVMRVIRKNLGNLTTESFESGAKTYTKNLRDIIELARQKNAAMPIYIIGIYNPFYLNFPDMVQMQEVVDNWNAMTESLANDYQRVYFVGINDQLYKGVNGQEGIVSVSGNQTTVVNDALFTEDHFHPNNTGYSIMADAIMERIRQTYENN